VTLCDPVLLHGRFVQLETKARRGRHEELTVLEARHRREDAGGSGNIVDVKVAEHGGPSHQARRGPQAVKVGAGDFDPQRQIGP